MRGWVAESAWTFQDKLGSPGRPRLDTELLAQVAGNWSGSCEISVAGTGEVVRTAVAELRRFMTDGGVTCDTSGAFPIRLVAADDPREESYRITLQQDGIDVRSDGPRGVLHGAYELERILSSPGRIPDGGTVERAPELKTRVLRSPVSPFWTDELDDDKDYYPDAFLETLSRGGFNAVWIRGTLETLVRTEVLPELGMDSSRRLEKLSSIIERARRYGIDVFLYFCEPRALAADHEVWSRHPELGGRTDVGNVADDAESIRCLCVSSDIGKEYLEEAYRTLFDMIPDIGGVFLITASENHTHCYSHRGDMNCSRCVVRQPAEVVTDLIEAVHRGVRRASPSAQVVAWAWSWEQELGSDAGNDIVARLPTDVDVMPDWERGGAIVREGTTYPVNEYSYSYIGPSPRFAHYASLAHDHGSSVFAKLQLCTTHELVTVPYYPIAWRQAEKWNNLPASAVSSVLASWIFGNQPCYLYDLFRELTWAPHPPVETVVEDVAMRTFGSESAAPILKAWRSFSDAFEHYPFSNRLVYRGPMNRGPTFPWHFPGRNIPMSRSWRLEEPGDSLDVWTEPFGPKQVQRCFDRFLETWEQGLAHLEAILPKTEPAGQPPTPVESEWIVAQAVAHHIRSTVHFLRFAQIRDAAGNHASGSDHVKAKHLRSMIDVIDSEIVNRTAYVPLLRTDSRLGFHSEVSDYLVTADDVMSSIAQLHELRASLTSRLA